MSYFPLRLAKWFSFMKSSMKIAYISPHNGLKKFNVVTTYEKIILIFIVLFFFQTGYSFIHHKGNNSYKKKHNNIKSYYFRIKLVMWKRSIDRNIQCSVAKFYIYIYIYVGLTNVSDSPNMSDYIIFPQTRLIWLEGKPPPH